jgi:hypothetical protein
MIDELRRINVPIFIHRDEKMAQGETVECGVKNHTCTCIRRNIGMTIHQTNICSNGPFA